MCEDEAPARRPIASRSACRAQPARTPGGHFIRRPAHRARPHAQGTPVRRAAVPWVRTTRGAQAATA